MLWTTDPERYDLREALHEWREEQEEPEVWDDEFWAEPESEAA